MWYYTLLFKLHTQFYHSILESSPRSQVKCSDFWGVTAWNSQCPGFQHCVPTCALSPGGTALPGLIGSAREPGSCAQLVLVISNRPGVEELRSAARAGIPTRVRTHPLLSLSCWAPAWAGNACWEMSFHFSVKLSSLICAWSTELTGRWEIFPAGQRVLHPREGI